MAVADFGRDAVAFMGPTAACPLGAIFVCTRDRSRRRPRERPALATTAGRVQFVNVEGRASRYAASRNRHHRRLAHDPGTDGARPRRPTNPRRNHSCDGRGSDPRVDGAMRSATRRAPRVCRTQCCSLWQRYCWLGRAPDTADAQGRTDARSARRGRSCRVRIGRHRRMISRTEIGDWAEQFERFGAADCSRPDCHLHTCVAASDSLHPGAAVSTVAPRSAGPPRAQSLPRSRDSREASRSRNSAEGSCGATNQVSQGCVAAVPPD